MTRIEKVKSAYARGLVTAAEAVNKLFHLATEVPPAELMLHVPEEWLAAVRRECERFGPCPPAGGVLLITSVCAPPGSRLRQTGDWALPRGAGTTASVCYPTPRELRRRLKRLR